MKKRNSNIEITPLQTGGGCCAPITSTTQKTATNTSCCEQPTDGSSCCDENESKQVNAQKTGCC